MTVLDDFRKLLPALRFRTVEPREGYWSGATEWGRNIVTVMPAAAGVTIPVANIDRTPGPPRLHTVQLFRGDSRLQQNSDVKAKVSYGIGGTNNEFFVDWGPGCQFSLAANSLRVDAVSFRPCESFAGANVPYSGGGLPLELGVTFGQGAVAHGRPLVLSEPVKSIATNIIPPAAGTLVYAIPDFARGLIVRAYRNGLLAGDPLTAVASEQSAPTGLLCTLSTQNDLAVFDAQVFAGLGEQGVPIPGAANQLFIGNTSNLLGAGARNLNAAYQVEVQWVLSL